MGCWCFHLLAQERLGEGNQLGCIMGIFVLSCAIIHAQNYEVKTFFVPDDFCNGEVLTLGWRLQWTGFEPWPPLAQGRTRPKIHYFKSQTLK